MYSAITRPVRQTVGQLWHATFEKGAEHGYDAVVCDGANVAQRPPDLTMNAYFEAEILAVVEYL